MGNGVIIISKKKTTFIERTVLRVSSQNVFPEKFNWQGKRHPECGCPHPMGHGPRLNKEGKEECKPGTIIYLSLLLGI